MFQLVTGGFQYATGDLAGTAAAARAALDHDPGTTPPVRADALILLGSGEMVLGRPGAQQTLADAVEAARALDDGWAMAHSQLAEGQRLLVPGEYDAATATLGDAEALARELGSPLTLVTRGQRPGHPGAAHGR